MKVCGIYSIRNMVNGKWYVGQGVNVYTRKSQHFCLLKSGGHFNDYLQKSFLKYGIQNFNFRVIETVPEDMLDTRERYWIVYYRSNERSYGYNLDSGGNFNKKHSVETKKKISKANKGRVFSEKHRSNLSKAHLGQKPWSTGKKFSKELRRKLSEAHKNSAVCAKHWESIMKSRIGCRLSDEHKRKVSESLRGRSVSKKTRRKISKTLMGHFVSEETRCKLSRSHQKSGLKEDNSNDYNE